MVEKNKMPEVRFSGFSNDWDECKLSEVADFSKGHGYSKNDLVEIGTPIILYGRLYTKYQSIITDVDTFAVDVKGSIYSTGNEVIVPASGETAEDIARASAVINSGILLGGDLNIIYPNSKVNSIFLALSISNGKISQDLSKRAQGKSVVHLRNTDLMEIAISYPLPDEQTQIGTFFKNLDHLIILHQQKYNKLVTIKKAMLEKMFPKEGANVPEIRFRGFTEDWEGRKLGELVLIKSGWSPSNFCSGNALFIKVDDLNYSIREQDDSQMKVEDNLKFNIVKKGSIIFPKRGAAIMTNKVRILANDGYMDTNMMALEPIGINGDFLYLFISKIGLYKIADTSTIPQINNKHIEPYEILSPSKKEQEKIGNFFKNTDNFITLYKRELEKLKNLKKACLEKMFV